MDMTSFMNFISPMAAMINSGRQQGQGMGEEWQPLMAQGGNMWTGTPGQVHNINLNTPQQGALQNQVGQMAGRGLQNYQPSQFNFAPIENMARTQFNTQTVPSIAERFTRMGGDTRGSSAMTGALGNASAGLEQGLAALRSQYGYQQSRDQMSDLLQFLMQAMEQKRQPVYMQTQPGLLQSAAGPAMQAGMKMLPMLFGA